MPISLQAQTIDLMAYIVWLDEGTSPNKAAAVGGRAQAQTLTVNGVAWPMQRRTSPICSYTLAAGNSAQTSGYRLAVKYCGVATLPGGSTAAVHITRKHCTSAWHQPVHQPEVTSLVGADATNCRVTTSCMHVRGCCQELLSLSHLAHNRSPCPRPRCCAPPRRSG